MKTTLNPARRDGEGYALLMTLTFLATVLLLLSGMLMWTSTNSKQAARNNVFNQSEAAAEAATEKVLSQMDRDFLYGAIQNNTVYEALIPNSSSWPVQYTFSDPTNNVANQTYVDEGTTNWETLDSQYAGLYGDVLNCYVTSTATPTNAPYTVSATVSQYLQAASIPIFQFAIFYNINLEFNAAASLNIAGPVFSNQGIWIGGNLNFASSVQAVGKAVVSATDPFGNYSGGTGSTFAIQPTSGNNALTLPIAGNASTNTNPTNIEAILNLPPSGLGTPNTAAYAPSNQMYLFNEADLIISNASFGTNGIAFRSGLGTSVNTLATNFTVWFQDQKNTPFLQPLTNDYIILKNTTGTNANNYASTNILYSGFSFLTNVTFYDYRESDTCQVVQVDVTNFSKWLSGTNMNGIPVEGSKWNTQLIGDMGHGIGCIYVYTSIPTTAAQLPAVRLVNGGQLPTNYPGLTVATPFPLYVKGNYNVKIATTNRTDINSNDTAYTYPAALMGDSLTILSSSWSDGYSLSNTTANTTTLGNRAAVNTTINAACLAGIVPSNTNIVSGTTGCYSGGVENFFRLEESWSSITLYYNGSIVVMFPSIYATNYYVNVGLSSSYYAAPTRKWAFDNNFKTAGKLPPCAPASKALIRGNWVAY